MAVSVKTSGSQTATLDTEHALATITDAGVYVLAVDAAALASGESLRLCLYGKARSSDTERLVYQAAFSNAQTEPLKESVPVVSPHHLRATLTQSGGTGRSYPWAIYAL